MSRTSPHRVYGARADSASPALEAIPTELKGYPSWVVWRQEERHGKITKVPYTPLEEPEHRASVTDLRTWRSFPEARGAYELGGFDGIGFVFSSGDPYAGTDLDECRDPETGELEPWARKIIGAAPPDAYVEVSPSGRGVHIITRGKAPNGKRGAARTRHLT